MLESLEVPLAIVNPVRRLHWSNVSERLHCRLASKPGVQVPTGGLDLASKEEDVTVKLIDCKPHVGQKGVKGVIDKSHLIQICSHKGCRVH